MGNNLADKIRQFLIDERIIRKDIQDEYALLIQRFLNTYKVTTPPATVIQPLQFLKKYYEWDENEFEPQVGFAKVSLSDLEQLINEWEASKGESTPPNQLSEAHDRGCPCLYLDEPCHPMCTCKNGASSLGCMYCATYGSIEQRTEKAKWLSQRIKPSPNQLSGIEVEGGRPADLDDPKKFAEYIYNVIKRNEMKSMKDLNGYYDQKKEQAKEFFKNLEQSEVDDYTKLKSEKWDGRCKCGHLHSEHHPISSPNYSAGSCKVGECRCKHFIHEPHTNKVNEESEGEERKFSLKEALEIWDAGHELGANLTKRDAGRVYSFNVPNHKQYFKDKFGITLP